MRVQAAVAEGPGAGITIEELDLEAPRRGEVLVRMRTAGICQSDVHVVDGWMPEPFPLVLGRGGTAVVIGLTRSDAEVALPAFDFVREKRMLSCYYGSARPGRDIPMLVDLYRDGRLRPEVALDHTIGLDEIEQAFVRMRTGEAGRTIIRL